VTDAQLVPLSPVRRRLVLASVMTAMALSALEQTVVGTAMPTVIARLGGLSHYSWVFTAYLLALTVTGPIWGKLSDSHGRRPTFNLGIGFFLLGSALAGQSQTMMQLIVFRAIQGIGAGALMPLCMTILGDLYTLRQRVLMQGYISSVWGAASLAGPLLGGFLTDQISWRWVFYVNLPFGLLACLGMFAWEEPKLERSKHALDFAGALTLSAGVVALLLELSAAGRAWPLLSPISLGLLAVSAVLLAWFWRIEHRTAEPIVAPELFANAVFRGSVPAGVLSGAALYCAVTFMPLFVQTVVGTSATQAGTVMTPMMLTWVLANIPVGRAIIRFGYRAVSIAGGLLLLASFTQMALLGTGASWTAAASSMVLAGAGLSCFFMPLTVAVQSAVPRLRRGMATSALQFVRSMGGAIGVAVLGVVLANSFQGELAGLAPRDLLGLDQAQIHELALRPELVVDPRARAQLPQEVVPIVVQALAVALHHVFLGGVFIGVLLLASAFLVPGGRVELHQYRGP
jgi:EmrB/QacA subfamily drug resistance transporter